MTGVEHSQRTRPSPRTWGEGVDAVLVHGSISTGAECWERQRPLADHGFRLSAPDRAGYGDATERVGEDFLRDAEEVAELLGDGAHLVGHSYGGVVALLAAAARPEAVLSLAVIEPPAFALAQDDPAVAGFVAGLKELLTRRDLTDRGFLEGFLGLVGVPTEEIPQEMLEHWSGQVGPVRGGRPPWEAEIPLDRLGVAPFPKLVVSGGHHAAFDAVCDELTRGLGAERVVIPGAGHEVQMTAEPFNEALLGLWHRVSHPISSVS